MLLLSPHYLPTPLKLDLVYNYHILPKPYRLLGEILLAYNMEKVQICTCTWKRSKFTVVSKFPFTYNDIKFMKIGLTSPTSYFRKKYLIYSLTPNKIPI